MRPSGSIFHLQSARKMPETFQSNCWQDRGWSVRLQTSMSYQFFQPVPAAKSLLPRLLILQGEMRRVPRGKCRASDGEASIAWYDHRMNAAARDAAGLAANPRVAGANAADRGLP